MGYIGEALHSMDHKGRVFIPAKYRKLLVPEDNLTMVITRGLDRNLLLFPYTVWNRYVEKLLQLPYSNRDVRSRIRVLTSRAEELSIDSQGRIMLPRQLLEYAGIKKEVLFIGMLDKVELWNPEIYREFEKENMSIEDGFEILGI
ncbi:division/cell wall cluster transcriptional repressor MraZ [candidate division WOR-3 bacterium]|nr:division/cell wall cluster transcriptional repressor MraZ [candidate division WOR-3 bacterium]